MAGSGKLSGKVAIVTGGAKGIGYACALRLGQEGASVLIADLDVEGAVAAVSNLLVEGVKVKAVRCDVRSRADVDRTIEAAVAEFGSVDIMVANAGIVKTAHFLDMSEDDFNAVIDVNLKGVFLTCQAAARQMVKQNQMQPGRGGAIITMSSVNGVMAIPTIAGYNAAKGGVNNLTRCMAIALASHNIRVNGIGPGSIKTDVLNSVVHDKAALEKVLSRTPLGRIGLPQEIGNICVFLASESSSYITGQIIYADGGRMALNYTCPVKSVPPATP